MRAIICEEFGTPDLLKLREIPAPEPGAGQVRMRVRAAGVNFPDSLVIANRYQHKLVPPFVPGMEAAGVVDAVGANVTGFKLGDHVAAFGRGAFAEQMVVDASRSVLLPDTVSFESAAGLTVTYGTTIYALRSRGLLRPGETLLVLGAGGGVGTAAVELGKLLGARVIAAASSPEKLAVAARCGADDLIDYRSQNLREALRAATEGKGVDVVYDPVGGDLSEAAFRSLGWNGRLLVVGFASGTIPALPLNLALLKGASVVGVFWDASIEHEPARFRTEIADLVRWLDQGKIQPRISARYKLPDTPRAISDLMHGGSTGKLVIEID